MVCIPPLPELVLDPVRMRNRITIDDVMLSVVRFGETLEESLARSKARSEDLSPLRAILEKELDELEECNCVRYRLSRPLTAEWIARGRPR